VKCEGKEAAMLIEDPLGKWRRVISTDPIRDFASIASSDCDAIIRNVERELFDTRKSSSAL
jgi:hypothetical protein